LLILSYNNRHKFIYNFRLCTKKNIVLSASLAYKDTLLLRSNVGDQALLGGGIQTLAYKDTLLLRSNVVGPSFAWQRDTNSP